MPIRVSSNILSHGTIAGESIVALAIRPRMKCMRGVWHKSRNFSVHHIDLRPGVVGYISNPIALFSKNSITIDIFGNSFYRNYDFGAGDDTGIYWNSEVQYPKETMLYFTTAMEKALFGKYSYGKKLRSSQSFNFKMQLPTKNNEIDFTYMELLISAVKKLVIKDVVLYTDNKINATKKVISKN